MQSYPISADFADNLTSKFVSGINPNKDDVFTSEFWVENELKTEL